MTYIQCGRISKFGISREKITCISPCLPYLLSLKFGWNSGGRHCRKESHRKKKSNGKKVTEKNNGKKYPIIHAVYKVVTMAIFRSKRFLVFKALDRPALHVRKSKNFSEVLDRTYGYVYRLRHGIIARDEYDTSVTTDNSCSICSMQFSQWIILCY